MVNQVLFVTVADIYHYFGIVIFLLFMSEISRLEAVNDYYSVIVVSYTAAVPMRAFAVIL